VLRELLPDAEFLVVTRQDVAESDVEVTRALDDVVAFSPDIVVLAGPATLRRQAVDSLGAIGASFFLEKPLAHSLADASAVVNALESTNSEAQVGYNLRFSESLSYFRHHVHAHTFGRVLGVRAETGQYLPDWRPGTDYRDSVSARADLGGGVLLELSHELDYLRWIFGLVQWASGWTGRTSSLDIDVDDTALVTFGFEGAGSSAVVGTLALDFVRRDRTRLITVLCEKATLRWDGISGCVDVLREDTSEWETLATDSGGESTYHAQWKSFLSRGDSSDSPAATLQDGLEVLRLVEAIQQSHAQNGVRVRLSEIRGGS
jgi:predicted dehydrogenase